MISIQPEQLIRVSNAEAVTLLQPFAGHRIGIPQETVTSPLDSAASIQDVLELFYNGGAFRAIRSVLMGSYGRPEQDETGPYYTTHYPFIEFAEPGDRGARPGAIVMPNGLSRWQRERYYSVRYYPDDERITGRSDYTDGLRGPVEPVYSIAIAPSDLQYGTEGEMRPLTSTTELAVATLAIKQLATDVANDTALGLSGA